VRLGADGSILGECGDRAEDEGKPKCLPQKKAQSMSKAGRAKIVGRKRRADPDKERSGGAINVSSED